MKKIFVISLSLMFVILFQENVLLGEDPGIQYAGYINLNTATYEQLLELPDMAEDMARNIVSYRETNGPFASVDDLIRVQGFWYTYIDQIRPYIKLEGENTLRRVEP